MDERLTWSRGGCWGIEGVDLASLPPRAYRALCMLKVLEDAMERGDDVSESDTEGGGLA